MTCPQCCSGIIYLPNCNHQKVTSFSVDTCTKIQLAIECQLQHEKVHFKPVDVKTLGVVVVMVFFLWFYIDGKGITNAKPTSMLATLGMVVYAHVESFRSFKAKSLGKS